MCWAAVIGAAASSGGQEGVGALLGGLGGFFSGMNNAKIAKNEGRQAYADAVSQAGAFGASAQDALGRDRAAVAASGLDSSSAAEALSQKAQRFGLDIDAILAGGRARKAALDYEAKLARREAKLSLAGGVLGAVAGKLGSKVFEGIDGLGGKVNPAVANPGVYGQAGRYGTGKPLLAATGTGKLIGGV